MFEFIPDPTTREKTLQNTPIKQPGRSLSEGEKGPDAGGLAGDPLVAAREEIRALEAELERYRFAVLASRDGLWDWHLESGRIWYSPQILEMLGWDMEGPDNPNGSTIDLDAWMAAIHPEDRRRVDQAIENHLKYDTVYDLEYRFCRPDGEVRWLRTAGRALRDETVAPKRMLGTIKDVTEDRAAEESRRRSEAYFKALFDSMNIGVTITRADGSYVLTNGAYQKLVGYGAEELQNMRWQDISDPDEIGQIEQDIQTLAGGGARDIAFEKRFRHKNGGIVWARLTIALFGGDSEKASLRAAIVEDITERKLAEQALRDSQAESEAARAYLTGALESMDNGFALFDADERLVMCNEQFRALAPQVAHLYQPGARFADIIRGGTEQGQWRLGEGGKEAFIERRVADFRAGGRFEMPRADGAWIEAYDHKTEDGQTISYRIDITERKQAEEALRRSEASLNEAQKIGRLGSWYWTAGSDEIHWSDGFKTLFGLPADTAIENREDAVSRIHPDDVERVEASVLDAMQNGTPHEQVYRIRRADGVERILRGTGEIIRDERGEIVRLSGVTVDVTEQIEAEQALRRSEENLREAQFISSVGNWESIGVDNLNRWSDEVFRIFGRDRESFEATYDNFFECVHHEDREAVRGEIERGSASGKAFSYRHRIVRPDGEVRHVLQRTVPRRADDGTPLGRAGIIQDITEQIEAEEALRNSEHRLREAQHISNIGDWESVGATENRRWSDEIYRILGRDPENFESTYGSYMSCIHPDDRDRVATTVREGMASGRPFSFEHRIVRPDGGVRHVLQRAVSRPAESGEMGRAGTIQDITERKELEERLQQAQKMEVVGQLTGGIAHDFNNLLSVIMGNLELIGERVAVGKEAAELIERGVLAAERGANLTHRLLAFSRRQTLMPVALDLNMLVSGMTEMLRRTLGETVRISTREPADLWLCEADRSQLENALLNLAINARDAMPGGGKLTIETANVTIGEDRRGDREIEPGAYVMLSAADTGSGISEGDLEHVLEPFFTTKDVGKGSGLGLSMVYGFARQSGGTVTIDSEPGKGTVVKLYLPRATEETARREDDRVRVEIKRGKGERVLVVEDDPDVREQAEQLLASLGYETTPAETARAALNLIAASPRFELILSDVVLPDLNGPALAEEILHRDPDAAILFMTGYAKGTFEHHAKEEKSAHLINKPFSRAELARAVYDALQRL